MEGKINQYEMQIASLSSRSNGKRASIKINECVEYDTRKSTTQMTKAEKMSLILETYQNIDTTDKRQVGR